MFQAKSQFEERIVAKIKKTARSRNKPRGEVTGPAINRVFFTIDEFN
jgi:hypothetical protein